MRTVLRKLFGASIGGGAAQSFFVFALTALIAGAPLAARAQDSAVVGTVTFRDKTADSIVADGVLSFTDLTQANGSTGNNQTNKFQTNSNVGSIVTFFSPRQTLGSGQSWTATFTATETITFDSVRFGCRLYHHGGWRDLCARHHKLAGCPNNGRYHGGHGTHGADRYACRG